MPLECKKNVHELMEYLSIKENTLGDINLKASSSDEIKNGFYAYIKDEAWEHFYLSWQENGYTAQIDLDVSDKVKYPCTTYKDSKGKEWVNVDNKAHLSVKV